MMFYFVGGESRGRDGGQWLEEPGTDVCASTRN